MWQVVVDSAAATVELGRSLGELLANGDIILLSGGLGSGKTTLTQGIAVGLGVGEPVTSPSFTLVHEYAGRLPLYHLDLYRLDPEAVWELGLVEYFGRGVVVVEWPERLGALLPREHLWVDLQPGAEENERLVRWRAKGSRHRRLLKELRCRCASWALKRQVGP